MTITFDTDILDCKGVPRDVFLLALAFYVNNRITRYSYEDARLFGFFGLSLKSPWKAIKKIHIFAA